MASNAEKEEWLRLRCVMPISVTPMWNEIQRVLREYGVTHHNKGIEAGMHMEILMAEFMAGHRVPLPEGWHDGYTT